MMNAHYDLDEKNISLSHMIEDSILFGGSDEIDCVLSFVKKNPDISDNLRYGLEGLQRYRAHYFPNMERVSALARQRIRQFDTDWSMRLLDYLRENMEDLAEIGILSDEFLAS